MDDSTNTSMRMIDIHSHVLYGMDDGATEIRISIEMLKMYASQHVTDVFCTPHSEMGMYKYHEKFEKLQAYVQGLKLPIHLHKGCEVEVFPGNLRYIADALNRGSIQTMNDSCYVLIEFEPEDSTEEILEGVRFLMEKAPQWIFILAHVERYRKLREDESVLRTLKSMGCLFQVNAYSLQGEQNPATVMAARKMLNHRWIDLLGSDAHGVSHRPPKVEDGVKYILDACDIEYAKDICYRNAERLILGRFL